MNAVFSIFKNKNKDNNNTNTNNNGPSYAGRAVSIRSNQRISDETIKKAKAAGITDKQIEDIIRQSDREDFERDLENYKSNSRTIKNKAQKSAYAKEEKARLTEKYGTYGGNFDKALTDYKNSPTSKNNDMEKWSSSEYKLSKDEKKDAKEYYNDFLDTRTSVKKKNGDNYTMKEISKMSGSNQGAKIFEKLTQEEKNEYAKMTAMKNKTSGVSSFASGVMSAFPLVSKEYDKLTGYLANDIYGLDGDYSYSEAQKNAKKQNGAANFVGNAVGTAAKYMAAGEIIPSLPGVGGVVEKTGKALSKLPVVGKLGEKALTGYAADMAADLALDTLPEYLTNKSEGMSDEEALKQAGKNVAINAGMNAAFGLLPAGIKNIKAENKKAAEEAAEEVTKNVNEFFNRKTAEEAIEETAEKEVADVVKEDINSVVPQATKGNVDISNIKIPEKTKVPNLNNGDLSFDVPTLDNNIKWGRNKSKTLGELLANPELSVAEKENLLNKYVQSTPVSEEGIRNILANPNIDVATKEAVLNAANKNKAIPEIITGNRKLDNALSNIPGRVNFDNTKVPSLNNTVYDDLVKGNPNANNIETLNVDELLGRTGAPKVNADIPSHRTNNVYDSLAKENPDFVNSEEIDLNNVLNEINNTQKGISNKVEAAKSGKVIQPPTKAIPSPDTLKNVNNVGNMDNVVRDEASYVANNRSVNNVNNIPTNTTGNVPTTPRESIEIDIPQVNQAKSRLKESKLKHTYENSTDAEDFAELYPDFNYMSTPVKTELTNGMKKVKADPEGTLLKYISDSSNIAEASDVQAAFILKKTLEKQRKAAIESGDEVLAKDLTERLLSLKKNIQTAGRGSGQFINSFKIWARNDVEAVEAVAYDILRERGLKLAKKPKVSRQANETTKQVMEAVKDLKGDYLKALRNNDKTTAQEIELSIRDKVIDTLENYLKEKPSDELVETLSKRALRGTKSENLVEDLLQYQATGKLSISEETSKKVEEIYKEMEGVNINSKKHVDLEAKAYSLLADEVCNATFMEKWNAWRYFSMLSKPKTHIRNFFGNTMFSAVEGTRDKVAALLELGLSKENRTKTLGALDSDLVNACKGDALENSYRQLKGMKYDEGLSKSLIEKNKRIFDNDLLEKSTKANSDFLEKADTFAAIRKYQKAQAGFLQAKGYGADIFTKDEEYKAALAELSGLERTAENADLLKELTAKVEELKPIHDIVDKSREYAIQKAKVATFHEDNEWAKRTTEYIKGLTNSDSPGVRVFGLALEGVLPFVKTPANILRQGVKYSPIELGKVLLNDVLGNSGRETSQILDDVATGMSGTALVALGMWASEQGLIVANDVTAAELAAGKSKYSLNIGDKSIPIDWLVPAAMPVIVGANLMELKRNDGFSADDVYNSVLSIADPIFETTMLDGLNDLFKSMGNANRSKDNAEGSEFATAALKASTSYLTQGVPGILGGIVQSADNVVRTSRSDETGPMSIVEQAVNSQKAKLPGLVKELPKVVDIWGENKTYGDNFANAAVNTLINPTSFNKVEMSAIDNELNRLERVGYDSATPAKPNRKVTINSEEVRLTNKELEVAETVAGKAKRETYDYIINSPEYATLSDESKNKLLAGVNALCDKMGYSKALSYYETEDEAFNIANTDGVEAALDYLINDTKLSKERTDIKNEYGLDINKNIIEGFGGDEAAKQEYIEKKQQLNSINQEFGIKMPTNTFNSVYDDEGIEGVRQKAGYIKATEEYNSEYNQKIKVDEYTKYAEKGATNKDILFLTSLPKTKKTSDLLSSLASADISNAERSKYLMMKTSDSTWDSGYASRGLETFGPDYAYQILALYEVAKQYDPKTSNDKLSTSEARSFVNDTFGKDSELAATWYKVLTGKDY